MIDPSALTNDDILELARDNDIVRACCEVWQRDGLNTEQALRFMVAHLADALQQQRIDALKRAILAPAAPFEVLADDINGGYRRFDFPGRPVSPTASAPPQTGTPRDP